MASSAHAHTVHEGADRERRPRPPPLEDLGWTPEMIAEAPREEAKTLAAWEDEDGDYEDARRRRPKAR